MPSDRSSPPLSADSSNHAAVNDRLELSSEDMRALGYHVIDMLVDHFATLKDKRVPHPRKGARVPLEARLREPVPEQGMDAITALDKIQEDIVAYMSHVSHPRFFAFIPGPSNFVSVMAETLASGLNPFTGTWIGSSGTAMLEEVVVDWLRQLCGMPETAGGLFVSGGSMANLTALAVARHKKLNDDVTGAVIYMSNQTHSSLEKGIKVLGFAASQLRKLPTDDRFRLDVDALRTAVANDHAAGRVPFCVIANAGTTNTGAVDPMETLATFCRDEDLWMHVDGAYGAAAVICDRGREALRGMEKADSLSLDPHKWLFQPFETGCVLVRDRRWLRHTFHAQPEYLQDTKGPDEEINFAEYGIQLTRSFRAIKVWLSFKVFGLPAFRKAVEHGFVLAEAAEHIIRNLENWEIVTPAEMGIVSFRYAPPSLSDEALSALNVGIVERMNADGYAMLSTTVLHGNTVLRLCPINPRTTEDDIRETLVRLDTFGQELAP